MKQPRRPITDPAKFLHVSSEPYHLPPVGKDPTVDEMILRGELKVIETVQNVKGETIRLAVSKGKTYRKPKA